MRSGLSRRRTDAGGDASAPPPARKQTCVDSNAVRVRGLCPRTFTAKRRNHPARKASAFACSVSRNEELAVRALEAAMAFRVPGDQLGRERLLAMRADDLLRGLVCGKIGHSSTVPLRNRLREEEPVVLETRALRRRRIGSGLPEMHQAEEPLAVGKCDRFPPSFRT